jgi:hypothetical protein
LALPPYSGEGLGQFTGCRTCAWLCSGILRKSPDRYLVVAQLQPLTLLLLCTGDFVWGSPTFHKMGRQKVELARLFTSYGLDLCLCDVDTVWIRGREPWVKLGKAEGEL